MVAQTTIHTVGSNPHLAPYCSSNRGGKLLEAYPNGQLRIHGVHGIRELELRVLIGKLSIIHMSILTTNGKSKLKIR